jgi:hypothetical protein
MLIIEIQSGQARLKNRVEYVLVMDIDKTPK